ncbi:MAG: leucine-rich repeat domain-containing protein [Bacteroidales bacterium]
MKHKLLFMLLIMQLTLPLTALAETTTIDNINYEINDDDMTASIIESSISGDIIIPATITVNNESYTVISIDEDAFINCTNLTSVSIPETVTYIGGFAFYGCTNLTSISIPKSVSSIENYAFNRCTSLINVYVEWESPIDLDSYSFENNGKTIKVLIVPEGAADTYKENEKWSNYFLYVVSSLDDIIETTIDDITYRIMDNNAIVYKYNNSDKNSCDIPSSISYNESSYPVTTIGEGAFYGFTNLTSISIPESVSSIGDYAFSYCSGLTSVIIPESVSSIKEYSFLYCTDLASVTIPESVTSIGYSSFSYCTSLTSVSIPESVTTLDNSAFYYCTSLESIDIPNSVTYIGTYIFYNCTSLTSANIPESISSIERSAFHLCSSLTSIIIPESVSSIGKTAFYGCTNLTSINIPYAVAEIGDWAFGSCDNLTSVKVNWETPFSADSDLFSNSTIDIYNQATLSVPAGTLEAYQEDTFWGQFNSIIEDSSLAVEDNLVDNSVKVYTVNGTLMVSGAADGATIKIYNLTGVNVVNGVAIDGVAQIELPTASGIYIVTVGNQSYKVIK